MFVLQMWYERKKKPMDKVSIGFDRQSVEWFPDAKMTVIYKGENYDGQKL